MEKYQAKKNNIENNQEDVPQKSQDEINAENNANNLRNAADVAIATKNPYAMAAGYAVKGLDKVTGGKSTQAMGKALNKANKIAPGGKQIQNVSNKLSESGASDAVGKAASMKSGGGVSGASKGVLKGANGAKKAADTKGFGNKMGGGNNSSSSRTSSSSGDSFISGNIMDSLPKGIKIKIYIGIAISAFSLLFLFFIFSDPDDMNMGVTNDILMTNTSTGVRNCTPEEIENKLVYIGDSRVNGMNNALNNSNIQYYSGGGDYFWLKDVATPEIERRLSENSDQVIVLSMGLRDLSEVNNYIDAYRYLINKYPSQIFIMSINPVDETKVTNGITNIQIENFNMTLSQNFPNNFIDIYSTLGNVGTSDGINYDNATYQNINSNLTSNLSTSSKVKCSAGPSNIVYYNQTDYPQSYGYGTTISSHGCAPTCMAMILSTLKNEEITPIETAEWSYNHGFNSSGGTTTALFPAISNEYGIQNQSIGTDAESIKSALMEGKLLVVLVEPGIFSSTINHFFVITSITSDGQVTIADPASIERTNQLWDINTIVGEGIISVWSFWI